jgi:cyclopropane fatty-acyl-phospholipid synthase-like methyltransferase
MVLADLRKWLTRPLAAASARTDPAPDPPGPVSDPPRTNSSLWPPIRIDINARLWGEGYISPGGEYEAMRLANPLGLSTAASLLLLNCGPGGPVRTMASQLGVWVTGFEADPDLLAAGTALCAHSGLGRRALMQSWNPAAPRFERRSFHHSIAFDPVREEAPEAVLAAIALALRPEGQIALVQTVADTPLDPSDPMVCRWARMEGRSPSLPNEATISRVLGRLGFEIRVAEDISQRHARLAVRDWHKAIRELREKPEPAAAATLVQEAELWLLRIRLIRRGKIRFLRWHAIHRVAQ